MAKFRKKPVVIEAEQFTGDDIPNILLDENDEVTLPLLTLQVEAETGRYTSMSFPTLEGDMTASLGDWIIKGVNGEFYPCKPDIFEKTYDLVEEV